MTSKRKQLDEILKYAAERGIIIPADILLDIGKKDAQELIDALRVNLADIPDFSLHSRGLVPAPDKNDLLLWSTGWKPLPDIRVPIGPLLGSGGGGGTHIGTFLRLDQTVAETVINGLPTFNAGLIAGQVQTNNYQNLAGTQSLVWDAVNDWWEFSHPLSLPASGLVMAGSVYNFTGGGTVALGGFTLTVPATGIAALLATRNVFTVQQMIDGTVDEIQLRLQANATQTANILEIETSGNVDLITIDPSGNLYLATTQMLQLRDAAVYINSATDGHLDLNADITIDANAPLVLVAGTATAGGAPIKFTSGALLATPEAGAMEFYDGRWYITGTAKQRVIDRTSSNVIVSTVTVSDTVTETSLYSISLSANAMKVGRIYKIHFDGIVSTASAADDITFNFYVGGVLYSSFKPAMGSITNKVWHADYSLTIRTIGGGGTSALFRELDVNGIISNVASLQAVDTTAASSFEIKVKWDNAKAGNTISLYQGYTEFKN